MSKPALLVIDMQHDFVDPSGVVPCVDALSKVLGIKKLVDQAHATGVPVIYTKEIHRIQKVDFGRELDGGRPLHCIEGTLGAEIVDELRPHKSDCVVEKRKLSGFFGTDLEMLLRGLGVDRLYLTGAATDVCVHYTAVDAYQLGFSVRIVEDCVAGTSKAAHEASLSLLKERLRKESIIQSSNAFEDFHAHSKE